MRNNLDRIGFQLSALDPDDIDAATTKLSQNPRFVPLADVPDLVWKNLPTKVVGGRDTSYRPRAGAPHPLRRHRRAAHHRRQDAAPALHGGSHAGRCRGLAGVLLLARSHRSRGPRAAAVPGLAVLRRDGRRRRGRRRRPGSSARPGWSPTTSATPRNPCTGPTSRTARRPRPPPRPSAQGVHSAYETAMVDAFSTEILAGLQATLTHRGAEQGPILSGHDAAVAVVRLMDRTAKTIKPADLVAVFAQTQVGKTTLGPTVTQAVLATLWDHVGSGHREGDGRRHPHAGGDLGGRLRAGRGVEHHPDGEHQGRRPGRAAGALPGSRLRAVARPRPHRLGPEPASQADAPRSAQAQSCWAAYQPSCMRVFTPATSCRWRRRRWTVRSERSSWLATAWSVSPASSSAEDLRSRVVRPSVLVAVRGRDAVEVGERQRVGLVATRSRTAR